MPERLHGSIYAYIRLQCRCEDCRAANAQYHYARRHRYWSQKRLTHGKLSTYTNYRCRCDACYEAKRAYSLRVSLLAVSS